MDIKNNIISFDQDIIFTACTQTYDNFYNFPKHMHQNAEIYFILNGSCSMYVADEKLVLGENDFIIIFPYVIHSLFLESDNQCEFYHIHLNLEQLYNLKINIKDYSFTFNSFQVQTLLKKKFFFYKQNINLRFLTENIVNEYNNDTPYSKIIANLNLVELIIKIMSIENVQKDNDRNLKTKEYVNQTMVYIKNNYHKKIVIQDIASNVHISTRYLSKIFYKQTGITIAQYINIYRVNQAIKLMSDDNINLSDIAYLVGLNDIQHFSKVFTKIINLSPQKYRKLVSKNS